VRFEVKSLNRWDGLLLNSLENGKRISAMYIYIYIYFRKFESIFKENGKKIVDLLVRHDIIEKIPKKEVEKLIETMNSEELEKLP